MNCPYCGMPAIKKDSKIIWGRSYGDVYICSKYPDCDSYVGCHRDGRPLGTLADGELRGLRMLCHSIFDKWWTPGNGSRKKAYKKLQSIMRMSRDKAHIAMFTKEDCMMFLRMTCNPVNKSSIIYLRGKS